MGLRVPEDVSIVGFDDLELAAWPGINLTTVRIDFPRMAELAADLILARLTVDKTAPTRHHVLPTELIQRGTHRSGASR
jgi:LacI family transcriptional regulator